MRFGKVDTRPNGRGHAISVTYLSDCLDNSIISARSNSSKFVFLLILARLQRGLIFYEESHRGQLNYVQMSTGFRRVLIDF